MHLNRKRLPSIFRKRSDKLKRDLEDAVKESPASTPSSQHNDNNTRRSSSLGHCSNNWNEQLICAKGVENIAAFGNVDYCEEATGTGDADMYTRSTHINETGYNQTTGIATNSSPLYMKFDAHENESHAVRWNPIERVVATGGADRKVKLWDVAHGSTEPRAVLGGSSAGINSVDFDSTGSHIIGTSNDYGARVWTLNDNRLRVSLLINFLY